MAKPKHEEHENHELWLVSYADFITLLFAFFVVMYSASALNIGKFKVISDSLNMALLKPVKGQNSSSQALDFGGQGKKTPPIPAVSSKEQFHRRVQAAMRKFDIAQNLPDKMEVTMTDHGIMVTLADSMLFESGQAAVRPQALPALQALSEVIMDTGEIIQEIRVEGHTDNVPLRTLQFPSNWDLSASRAASVLRVLTEQYQVKADMMSVVGYGAVKPLSDNLTPDNRAKNRRVEINVIMAE
ncbi:MAG: flagellar motor protein MotD [Nitrospira sp.]|nr:flagellar motor protein MotD [Nitrospira sp.]